MRSKKVAYVATVYSHLAAFHLPFMKDLQAQGFDVHAYASPDHRKEALIAKGLECRNIVQQESACVRKHPSHPGVNRTIQSRGL